MGDSKARNSEKRLYEFEVESQGWRYHMSNINAAIGKAQFSTFEQAAATRQRLAQIYNEVFADSTVVTVLPYEYDGVVPHIYVVRFKDAVTRDRIKLDLLTNLNVETALHWYPNHYLSKFRDESGSLRVTEDSFSRMLTLPLHTKLDEHQVRKIASYIVASLG
jgi:dTDP-4-amino-4,6-dideoxygalactose transaminase